MPLRQVDTWDDTRQGQGHQGVVQAMRHVC